MAVLGDGKLSGESAQCDLLEFGHHPIEPLTGEPAAAQCCTEIGPIQDLRARCRQRWCDSSFQQHPLYVPTPSAIDVVEGSRGIGVVFRPGAHADFQCGAVSERMAQERIETAFLRLIPLDVGDDRFRGYLFPVLDHAGMKSAEVGKVPILANYAYSPTPI